MTERFELLPFRFRFTARDRIRVPAGRLENWVRGGFGAKLRSLACVPDCTDPESCERRRTCAYARLFEPGGLEAAPSGLLDWPRPFVFRPQPLLRPMLAPGEQFSVDFRLFDLREPWTEVCVRSLDLLAREGLGAERSGVSLSSVDLLNVDGEASRRVFDGEAFRIDIPLAPVVLELNPAPAPATRIVVRFLSPTELKGGGAVWDAPAFPVLFARIRDRISTLRALYGAGPLHVDFKGLGERAARVRTVSADVRRVHIVRRSSKTGQIHPLGGFTGAIEYEGDLGEFLAYLRAARWTGVGRQTVWGKGAIEVSVLETGG